ncbi:MAG: efflux transporter outer membrane subunit [Steroidobacteraceae bacterium]|nr:efflux transporter outer membrane subunit [Nevskiaceae bacterium]MCP5472960.1 efflux transporter outer membrane subunit [Nevskiaceae bacterium]
MRDRSLALALGAVFLLAGCGALVPKLPEQQSGIAAVWPLPPTTGAGAESPAQAASTAGAEAGAAPSAADIGWRDFFTDPNLEQLIELALTNNRDLRAAVLNVERARAQYRVQRASRLPSIVASGAMTRSGGEDLPVSETASAMAGVPDFELDLFGRVRNLSAAQLQRYFAEEAARRAAQLTLIAEIANAYLTLSADQESQRVAREALANREQALSLTEKRHELGAVSALDVHQAQTAVETARTDVARYAGQVARDINALTLLVGAPVDPALLPVRFDLQVSGLGPLPAGLPSEVLLRRPDIQQTERLLRAANANIGAARAAFFPSVSLTGRVGYASDRLSDVFDSGTRIWSFTPQVTLPIFQGGRLVAGLRSATVDRDIALARYEKAIQSGFRDVADALALTRTLAEQKASQQALVTAAMRADELSRVRYEGGRDSYLVLLDSQRTLYSARQSLIATQLAEQSNRVSLYKVLGGGWNETTP